MKVILSRRPSSHRPPENKALSATAQNQAMLKSHVKTEAKYRLERHTSARFLNGKPRPLILELVWFVSRQRLLAGALARAHACVALNEESPELEKLDERGEQLYAVLFEEVRGEQLDALRVGEHCSCAL